MCVLYSLKYIGGGCNPYFQIRYASIRDNPETDDVTYKEIKIYDQLKWEKSVKKFKSDDKVIDIDCSSHNICICGDMKFSYFDWDNGYKGDDKMFHFWLNSKFITGTSIKIHFYKK